MSSLSKRGAQIAKNVVRMDLELSLKAQENQYHPLDNPEGTFPLNIAENKLSWTELKAKFKHISASEEIPDWVMGYTASTGSEEFRTAIAQFYERYLFSVPVAPNHVAASPGAAGVIEMSAFLLADAGDVAAIPAPAYPVYRQDIGNISGVERYDIITHHNINELGVNLTLTLDQLEDTKSAIEGRGKKLKLLILTTPDNPTGLTFNEQQLRMVADWCMTKEIHLVVNEIYALSRINRDEHQSVFYSFGTLMAEHQSEYLHHWYSFSKDFGISGFRVGIVHSYNEEFLGAYGNLNIGHSISNHTQWLIQRMLEDDQFLDKFIISNQNRLAQSYDAVSETLTQLNIPFVKPQGALFVWLDFSQYLSEPSEEGEHDFWLEMFNKTGILLTPGHGFGHSGYGLFRMVYPYVQLSYLKVALQRLEAFISHKSENK